MNCLQQHVPAIALSVVQVLADPAVKRDERRTMCSYPNQVLFERDDLLANTHLLSDLIQVLST